MAARASRTRALRVLFRACATLGLLGLFVCSSLFAVVLHLNQPAGRRLAARALSELLSDVFAGTLTLGAIDRIGPRGVEARDVTVTDSDARTVLKVSRLRAEADLFDLVYKVLSGDPKITLIVDHARVERAEALLVPSPSSGIPTLVEALTPVERPLQPGQSESETRHVRVWLPIVEVGRGFARGRVGALPTLEAEVSGVRGSVLASPKGASIDIVKFATVARGIFGTDARGIASLHVRVPGVVFSSFDGYLGELQFGSIVRYEQQRLDVTLDVPRARPESARALWPDWPLHKTASAHVEASGIPPKLDVRGRFDVEGAAVSANGVLDLGGTLGADLDVQGTNLDLAAFFPESPPTSIDLFTNFSIASSGSNLMIDVKGRTEPTSIAGVSIPAADIAGSYDQSAFEGRATVHEPGLPLRVTFTVKPNGSVDLHAESERFDLTRTPRLKSHVDARGLTRASVRARIHEKQLNADFSLDVQGFELGDVRLTSARLSGRSSGRLDQPGRLSVDATLNGQGLRAGRFGFAKVSATARGALDKPVVTADFSDPNGPSVSAKARVFTGGNPKLEDLELEIRRDQARVRGQVQRLELGEGVIVVRRLELTGDGGKLSGSFELRPGLLSLDAHGENLDLDAMARLLNLPRGQLAGRARVDAELVSARDVRRGRIRIGLGNATIGSLSGTSLSLKASLDGDDFAGDAAGQIAGLGSFGATWDTTLAGPIGEGTSFERATGEAEIQFQNLDLGYVAQLLPAAAGVEAIEGQGSGSLRLRRGDSSALPNVSILAQTSGLRVLRDKPPDAARAPAPIEGLDLVLSAFLNGESGESEAAVQLKQGRGTLASLSANARVDLPRIRENPTRLRAVLEHTPVSAKLVVDERRFDDLPPVLALAGLEGTLRLQVTMSGSYLEPLFDGKVDLGGIRIGAGEVVQPVDVCAHLEYRKETGKFGGRGQVFLPRAGPEPRVCGGQRVAQLSAGGTARWEDLTRLDEEQGTPRWTGSAGLLLEGLPLDTIAPLASAHLAGRAFGAVMLERREVLPQLSANVEIRRAMVDRMPLGDGRLVVHTLENTLRGEVDFARDGGALKSQLLCALNWDGVVPGFDDTQPVTASVQAKQVDAALFAPLLSDFFTDLGGSVDADFRLALAPLPKSPSGPRWTGGVTGTLAMNRGVMQLAGLALRLHDVRFRAEARGAGNGTTALAVSDLYARALSDSDNISGSATLTLKGLEIVSGRAKNVWFRDVPLVMEGVTHATARGMFQAELVRQRDAMQVDIKLDELSAELPRSSGRDLIDVDDNSAIELLQPIREPQPERSASALPWRFRIDLGNKTRLSRADLLLPISGKPEILVGEQTQVTGDIEIAPGGRLQLFGKNFTIDTGEAHFDTGDPEDPLVFVVASWRAPEDTTVYLEIRGRFKDLRMSARSDPPMSEAQVYALILGGSSGEESGSVAQSGVGMGADALGALLANTPFRRIQLRTVNEQTADQRAYSSYTAAYQASDTLVLEGSYKDLRSTHVPSDKEGAVSGAIDWRFHKNWSLRTEVGTIGTGLDLLWQYRY